MATKSPKIERLRSSLICAWCNKGFTGSYSQAKHFYYEGFNACCSKECRDKSIEKNRNKTLIEKGKTIRKGTMSGPCLECSKMYPTKKTDRQYCSMSCYTKSDAFKKRLQKSSIKGREASKLNWDEKMKAKCSYCEEVFRSPRSRDNKKGLQAFCSSLCYRKYKAELFDIWTANPQQIGSITNYDEFLTGDSLLSCPIDSCEWEGKHLSVHVVNHHGLLARDFKKLAGFNITSGLVCEDTHKKLCDRPLAGTALKGDILSIYKKRNPIFGGYISEERRQSCKKTIAMLSQENGPDRVCAGCGVTFQQASYFGRQKYCAIKCRTEHYRTKGK